MSTPEQSQVTRVGALNDDDGCISADAVFTLVIAACLIVDAGLVRLLIEICDRFMLPLFPFVIAGLFAAMVVPLSIGPNLRAAAAHLHDCPGTIPKYDGVH
jgi:uncharacterized membrane protein